MSTSAEPFPSLAELRCIQDRLAPGESWCQRSVENEATFLNIEEARDLMRLHSATLVPCEACVRAIESACACLRPWQSGRLRPAVRPQHEARRRTLSEPTPSGTP